MTAVTAPPTEPTAAPKKHRPHRGRIHFNPDLAVPYPMEMIQMGWETLESLNRFRFLTSPQVARLHFLGRPNLKGPIRSDAAARKAANEVCLRRLKDLQYVECLPIFRHTAANTFVRSEVNILTRKGHDVLRRHYEAHGLPFASRWSPKLRDFANQTLNHELAINDVAVAAIAGAEKRGLVVEVWQDDAQLQSLKEEGKVGFGDFCPDGLLILRQGETRAVYLIEADRGTESVRGNAPNSWERKMRRYGSYLKHRYPTDPAFPGLPQPLVLTVTTGPERLVNLLRATHDAGNRCAYWFTTREWIEPPYDFFDLIWKAPTLDEFVSLADHFSRQAAS